MKLPTLEGLRAVREPDLRGRRIAVLGAAGAVVGLFAVGGVMGFNAWQGPAAKIEEKPPVIARIVFPDEAALTANWPVFRGWGGSGLVKGTAWPQSWDGKTGAGIAWKTPVPLGGHGSPIVWKDRVFVTGADAEKREVYCYDTASGKLLWTGNVPGVATFEPFTATGFAASTPATDGTLVYAIFATGDVAAFDFTGARVWVRHLGKPESQYTYSASLTVWNGKVIVLWDVGGEPASGKAMLMALDGATGKTAWMTPRSVGSSWSSPIVTNTGGGMQIITSSIPWVIGYDAESGAEKWRAKLMEGDVAPSPVFANGSVYVANDRACIARIATDGSGDVTKSHVKWKIEPEDGLPDIVSPLADGKYTWTNGPLGTLNCFDATDGKKIWDHEFASGVQASPMKVGDEVWVLDMKGVMVMLSSGEDAKTLGSNPLGEAAKASPAFAGGRIYIRGTNNLYCIGTK